VHYDRIQGLAETFTPEEVSSPIAPNQIFLIAQNLKLTGIISEDDKQRWKRISMAMGKSQAGCKRQAKVLNLVI
jgi:hypothetical protein